MAISLAMVSTAAMTVGSAAAAAPSRLPVFRIVPRALSTHSVGLLAHRLGIPGLRVQQHSVHYIDPRAFSDVPMRTISQGSSSEGATAERVFDFNALAGLKVPSAATAIRRLHASLSAAGLLPTGARFSVSHSGFGAKGFDGRILANRALDTQVNLTQFRSGLPILGPGANIRADFASGGKVSTLLYSAPPRLARLHVAPVRSATAADAQARLAYQPVCPGAPRPTALKLRRKLVYYIPILAAGPPRLLLPQYLYEASAVLGGQTVSLRRVVLPAVGAEAPHASVSATASGANVTATAHIGGGHGPYTIHWSSCMTTLAPGSDSGRSVSFTEAPRGQSSGPVHDVVVAQVTDADGQTTTARAPVDAQAQTRARAAALAPMAHSAVTGVVDVGTEWLGPAYGLNGSPANAAGFATGAAAAGIPVRMNWGDNDVFASDFIDPSKGGDDTHWADNVDLMFYTGHANGDGFVTGNRGQVGGSSFVSYDKALWGNTDLDWLVVAACGPLQGIQTGDLRRWLPAFGGLHMLLGYAQVTSDNTVEGSTLWSALHGAFFLPPMKMRDAWALAALAGQPHGIVYGAMGLIRSDGVSNYDDHFWGRGPVGPEIPLSQANAYWWWWGTT